MDQIQVAKALAKKLAGMDISGSGLGAEIGKAISDYDLSGKNSALDLIIKKLNMKDNQKSAVASFIKANLTDSKKPNLDSLIDSVLSGSDVKVLVDTSLSE